MPLRRSRTILSWMSAVFHFGVPHIMVGVLMLSVSLGQTPLDVPYPPWLHGAAFVAGAVNLVAGLLWGSRKVRLAAAILTITVLGVFLWDVKHVVGFVEVLLILTVMVLIAWSWGRDPIEVLAEELPQDEVERFRRHTGVEIPVVRRGGPSVEAVR